MMLPATLLMPLYFYFDAAAASSRRAICMPPRLLAIRAMRCRAIFVAAASPCAFRQRMPRRRAIRTYHASPRRRFAELPTLI